MKTKVERLLWTHKDLDIHDPRRAEKGKEYLDWADEMTEVEEALIRAYFSAKEVPEEIAEDFVKYVDWDDNRHLAPMLRYLREK
ncbi:hypothetical protein [Salimicrobium flavidum]|uniref:Uncharacterized protein n=1 Tax=Salimicrobium flavidum TaxID=570947 RepID=A0A1N7JXW5_9BACI|nr:hypothetical protein [Salimicrobium flavidum]SIS54131.1 hypothetical protein SAMN05421687_10833 [Salimicrobium flavidum]